MANSQQVANAFTVNFVERVAKNAANFAEVYGRHSTLTINDFEHGISEVTDGEIPNAVQKWAASLQGSRLRVDSVNAAPLYGGVNVFMTLTAFGDLQQYYHIATTLESFHDTYGVDGFYIRHQVIARVGAVVPEPPAAPEPEPEPEVVQPEAPAAPEPEPEAAVAVEEPAQPEPEEKPAASAPATPAPAEPQPEEKPAPAPVSTKPKSWASLVSSAAVKPAEHKPVRVVAHEGGKKAAPEPAAPAAPAAAAAAKRPPPRERKAPEAVGDRLMFNTTSAVTDDEIRAALGASVTHLVSLRNNSAKGLVFMDFAEKASVFDELSKAQPTIGASKVKMSVFRQRSRD